MAGEILARGQGEPEVRGRSRKDYTYSWRCVTGRSSSIPTILLEGDLDDMMATESSYEKRKDIGVVQ